MQCGEDTLVDTAGGLHKEAFSMAENLPFTGLRILDLSQGIAGPYCTEIFWQQGAEVIKVEPPAGDWGRHVGVNRDGQSAVSTSYNGGKQSVCIDARTEAGQQVLRRLAAQADMVVQNFRPGVADKLGMGYAQLAQDRPDLVYVSISGYGKDGPYAAAPASDSVMQADSGLMFSNQGVDRMPRRVGFLLADIATALYAAQQATTALYQRAVQGVGSHIELSLFEACAALQSNDIASFQVLGDKPVGAVSAPNGVFDTADGRLSVLALNNDQFARLCNALERPEWLADERFDSNEKRMAHRDFLHAALAEQLRAAGSEHWEASFRQHDVLHAVVRDYEDLVAHPQAVHLGMFEPVTQPGLGNLFLPGLPGGRGRRLQPAPRIGEHTVDVLSKAGLGQEEINRLLSQEVIRQAQADK